jgi:seryl-tRNA synthetase
MIDIKLIRTQPEMVKAALIKRTEPLETIDNILTQDEKRRALTKQLDDERHEQKLISQEFGKTKDQSLLAKAKQLSSAIKDRERELAEIESAIDQALLYIPNLPDASTPEKEQLVRQWETPPQFDFLPRTHWELGAALGILDLETAARIAGSRFTLFQGPGAALERALVNFCLDLHTREHGYQEISPPFMVNEQCFIGAGEFPKMEPDVYRLKDEDLSLIPTAETALVNLHRDVILKEDDLPINYVAYTPCFRREAGSYGRDVRGMIRVHQFDKVEMVKFTRPEDSYPALETMVGQAEKVLELLNIPYRVKLLTAHDMAFQSAKTYDIEAWAAGVSEWLEVSSVSNCEAFQARRTNTRFRRKDGKVDYVHILNGSGLAFARTFISVVENNQQPDGSIRIPEVLRPYMNGTEKIEMQKSK